MGTAPLEAQLRLEGQLQLHGSRISDLAFDAAGALYSASWDGTVKKSEVPGGETIWEHSPHRGDIIAMDLDPGRGLLATGGLDFRVLLRQTQEFRLVGRHGYPVRAVTLVDGERLASFGDDGSAILWDLSGGSPPIRRRDLPGHIIDAAALAPRPEKPREFVAIERSGSLLRFSFDAARPVAVRRLESPARSLALREDGELVAVSTVAGYVVLLDRDFSQQGRFQASTGPIYDMAFLDGERLAVGDLHGRVLVWSLVDGALLELLEDRPVPATALAVSPDWLAVGFADGLLTLWRRGR